MKLRRWIGIIFILLAFWALCLLFAANSGVMGSGGYLPVSYYYTNGNIHSLPPLWSTNGLYARSLDLQYRLRHAYQRTTSTYRIGHADKSSFNDKRLSDLLKRAKRGIDDPANPYRGQYKDWDRWIAAHIVQVYQGHYDFPSDDDGKRMCLLTRVDSQGYLLPLAETLRLDAAEHSPVQPAVPAPGLLVIASAVGPYDPALYARIHELRKECKGGYFFPIPDWLMTALPAETRFFANRSIVTSSPCCSREGLDKAALSRGRCFLYSSAGLLLAWSEKEVRDARFSLDPEAIEHNKLKLQWVRDPVTGQPGAPAIPAARRDAYDAFEQGFYRIHVVDASLLLQYYAVQQRAKQRESGKGRS